LPEDRYEEWAEGGREELRRTYLALLVELAGIYEERAEYDGERAEYDSAIEALGKVVAQEPTNEEAHVGLMRLHAFCGRTGEALKHYERLSEALSRELGTEPNASTRALREQIAAGAFPPPPNTPPGGLPTEAHADAGTHNLPTQRTSFVGRERELVEVKRALAMTGLITLTGAAGSGKTRLALQVARDLVGLYPGGVWLVGFAPLSEASLVPQAVAEVLGVREHPGRSLTERIADTLRQEEEEETLLVFDNCEHLVDVCARLVDALLARCPRLRLLATSRQPLGVECEVVWRVPSLSAPATDRLPVAGELTRYDAVRLFLDRARLRQPGFDLTPENASAVAEVSRKLEGMPLAIELATARIGVLTVGQISERLEDPLGLLSAGPRSAAQRQQTMGATLEWSHDLLEEAERKLFRRLSVFAGGFTLEAAEAVGTRGTWSGRRSSICSRGWWRSRSWSPRREEAAPRCATGCSSPSGSTPRRAWRAAKKPKKRSFATPCSAWRSRRMRTRG
jgi:predicted ATPase